MAKKEARTGVSPARAGGQPCNNAVVFGGNGRITSRSHYNKFRFRNKGVAETFWQRIVPVQRHSGGGFAFEYRARLTLISHQNVAGHSCHAFYSGSMEDSPRSKLAMYQAVKSACDAKPSVWQRSEVFEDAFIDFCQCIENLILLQSTSSAFNRIKGIAVEEAVADRILSEDMDEVIEQFEAVDVAFVDDYTAARPMNVLESTTAPALTA